MNGEDDNPNSWRRRRHGGISVEGTGAVTVEPDISMLSIGITWRGTDLTATRQIVATKATDARDVLLELGVSPSDLQTSQVSVSHHNRNDRGVYKPDQVEFVVSTTMRAVFRDGVPQSQAAVDRLFDVVGEGLELRGLGFDCSDRSAAQVEARRLAFEDARAKAAQLAELAGSSLGPVRGIRELQEPHGPQPRRRGAMLAGEASIPIEGGSLLEAVSLHVRFALLDG